MPKYIQILEGPSAATARPIMVLGGKALIDAVAELVAAHLKRELEGGQKPPTLSPGPQVEEDPRGPPPSLEGR